MTTRNSVTRSFLTYTPVWKFRPPRGFKRDDDLIEQMGILFVQWYIKSRACKITRNFVAKLCIYQTLSIYHSLKFFQIQRDRFFHEIFFLIEVGYTCIGMKYERLNEAKVVRNANEDFQKLRKLRTRDRKMIIIKLFKKFILLISSFHLQQCQFLFTLSIFFGAKTPINSKVPYSSQKKIYEKHFRPRGTNFRASMYKIRKVHYTIRTNVLSSQRAAIVVRGKKVHDYTTKVFQDRAHRKEERECLATSYARTLRWPFAYTLLARSGLLTRGVRMAAKLF